MSLKCYLNKTIPDWQKYGSGNEMFGIQISSKYCLPIHNAYYSTNADIKVFAAVEVDEKGNEIGTTVLPTSIIEYDAGQYLTKEEDLGLNDGLYYLFFETELGDIFRTELFAVVNEEIKKGISFDSTMYTFDSTKETFDNDKNFSLNIKIN